jgi:hypothetical protein
MWYCSATWSVTEEAVACVSGFTPGTDWSPWALSCACIDWSCFKELSTDDSIDSAWVERKRNWGSGRVECRASTRGLDQTALRRIMVARSILSKLQPGGASRQSGVRRCVVWWWVRGPTSKCSRSALSKHEPVRQGPAVFRCYRPREWNG